MAKANSLPLPAFVGGTQAITLTPVVGTPPAGDDRPHAAHTSPAAAAGV